MVGGGGRGAKAGEVVMSCPVSCEAMGEGNIHKGRQDLMSMLGTRRELCSMCAGGECVGRGKGPCKGHEEAKHAPMALTPIAQSFSC